MENILNPTHITNRIQYVKRDGKKDGRKNDDDDDKIYPVIFECRLDFQQ